MMISQIQHSDSGRKAHASKDDWIEQLLGANLPVRAKVVGVAVTMHIDPATGRCDKLSGENIADVCAMDPRTCRRMLKQLEAEGWLRVRRSTGFVPNRIELATPANPSAAFTTIGGRAHG